MRVMTEQQIENRIARVNATMAMEGMPLTEEDKELLREIHRGHLSHDEAIAMLIEKYTSK